MTGTGCLKSLKDPWEASHQLLALGRRSGRRPFYLPLRRLSSGWVPAARSPSGRGPGIRGSE
jgi:hypothetical protein